MKKAKFNAKNFMQVLRYIKKHPEEWDQGLCCERVCGCFMHHANRIGKLATDGWWAGQIPSSFAKFFGITNRQVNWLFSPTRTIADFEKFYRERVELNRTH